jgi:CubicO group peptidase (beta-lactamase class C family)
VADIASHLSGLPDPCALYSGVAGTQRFCTAESLMELINNIHASDEDFRNSWAYNSLAYALLGILIEKLSGLSLAEFLKVRVFRPLSLNDTSVMAQETPGQPDVAHNSAHYVILGDSTAKEIPRNTYERGNGFSASFGVQSSTEDLLKWSQAVIEAAALDQTTSLGSPRQQVILAIRKTIEPVCEIQVLPEGVMSYCAGWFHTTAPTITFDIFYDPTVGTSQTLRQGLKESSSEIIPPAQSNVEHSRRSILYSNGYMDGWSANIHIYPKLGHAVVVLGNATGHSEPCGYISRVLTAVVCGDEVDPKVMSLLKEEVEEFTGQWEALHNDIRANRKSNHSEVQPESLRISGIYNNSDFGLQITILDTSVVSDNNRTSSYKEDGTFLLMFDTQMDLRLPLWHYHDNSFCFFPSKELSRSMVIPLFEDWTQYILHLNVEIGVPFVQGFWWQYEKSVDAIWFGRDADVIDNS